MLLKNFSIKYLGFDAYPLSTTRHTLINFNTYISQNHNNNHDTRITKKTFFYFFYTSTKASFLLQATSFSEFIIDSKKNLFEHHQAHIHVFNRVMYTILIYVGNNQIKYISIINHTYASCRLYKKQ